MQGTIQRERPMGVTILAILALILGVLGALGSLAVIGLGGLGASAGVTGTGLVLIAGVGLLIVSVLQIAFGIGAFMLKPWAWTLGVASQVLNLVLIVVNIVGGSDITSQLLGILLSGIILYYLFTPGVRAAFGKA